MALDITPLENSIRALERSIARTQRAEKEQDEDLEFFRTASIKAFEFTYAVSLGILKRFLEQTEADGSVVDQLSFNALVRLANERALLLSDLEKWDAYRKNRNNTSHIYEEEVARKILEIVPDFLDEARYLWDMLKKRLEDI